MEIFIVLFMLATLNWLIKLEKKLDEATKRFEDMLDGANKRNN